MASTPSLTSSSRRPSERIEPARVAIQGGGPVLIIDDCSPRGASAVAAAAASVTDETVNLLSRLSGGLLQVALSPERAAAFMLPPLRSRHEVVPSPHDRPGPREEWLVSVEARHGVGSGISIVDRRTTIRLLGSEHPQPATLARPGHLFPCRCHPGGVIARAAIPEAALDLVAGFGMPDAAVFSYLLDEQGEVSNPVSARAFAEAHCLPVVTLSTLISSRLRHESLIEQIASSALPTTNGGELKAHVFRSRVDASEHVALVRGTIQPGEPTLIRVHVEDPIEDLVGSAQPLNSRNRLDTALRQLQQSPCGVLVYLRPPLDRHALSARLLNPERMQGSGPAATQQTTSMMEFGMGAQILRSLAVESVIILRRSPRPYDILELFGLRVVGYRELEGN